jgi:hypothetical protein
MPENAEFQPWMDSPWVETMEDYSDNGLEEVIDLSKIAWFDVKMDLSDTDIEKKEKVEAIQEQIRLGILQPNGFPTGMQVPPGAYVPGAQKPFKPFDFPGAIGVPLPQKFAATPATRQLQAAAQAPPTRVPRMIPGILPALSVPHKGQDRSIFQRGEEKLARIQEMTRDRRK